MSARTLREKYLRRLRGLERYSRAQAWALVGWYVAQIVLATVAGHFLLAAVASVWTIAAIVALVMFVGTRLRGLNNIVHECSHASFAEERRDNAVIGSVCASLVLGCFKDYRDEHLSHHAHLGDYEHDLDLKRIEKLKLHEPLTTKVLLRHLVTPLIGRHLPHYLGSNMSARDGKAFLALKIALLVGAAGLIAWQPLTGAVFVIGGFVLCYTAINYWMDCLDHAGLVASEDDLDASRNLLAPSWARALLFPRNDCFHLVHHLFPQVPARHLQGTHEVLSEDGIYQSKQNAVRRGDLKVASGDVVHG